MRLAANARKTLIEIPRGVVGGNDHRNQRLRRKRPPHSQTTNLSILWQTASVYNFTSRKPQSMKKHETTPRIAVSARQGTAAILVHLPILWPRAEDGRHCDRMG